MAAAAAVEAEQRLGELWVGCAGYSYPHWRQGVFYPKGQKQENELRYYSSIFDTCEGALACDVGWIGRCPA